MNAKEVIEILQQVPDAIDVIVKGRPYRGQDEYLRTLNNTVIGCSIPDGAIPAGWRAGTEPGIQKVSGYRRIIYTGVLSK